MAQKGFNIYKLQIAAYIVAFIIIMIVLYSLMKRLGLIKSKEQRKRSKTLQEQKTERKLIESTITTMELFSPSYWKEHSKDRLLPESEAKRLAKEIHKSWGWPTDDEERVYGAFRSLTDPVQVSQVSFYYLAQYNEDLAGGLTKRLDKKELQTVYNIIKSI